MRQAEPIRAAEPVLARLREALELTCFIAVMGNRGPTILRIEEPGLPVIVNVRAGSVLSLLGSATGRLFLGLLDDSTIDAMAQAELATAPDALREQLDARDPIGALRRAVRAADSEVLRKANRQARRPAARGKHRNDSVTSRFFPRMTSRFRSGPAGIGTASYKPE